MGKGVQKMKKESNGSLFFLLAVGIVGLGLYFGASENYSAGELQMYHIICWVVLLIALLRVLELIWEPVRSLWDQAWGKAQEKAGDQERVYRASKPEQGGRVPFVSESEKRGYSGLEESPVYQEKESCEEEKIQRADGVIIMPDRGSRLYLDDRYREPEKRYEREYDTSEEASFRPISESVENESKNPVNQSSDEPEKKKNKDKKKKKKK